MKSFDKFTIVNNKLALFRLKNTATAVAHVTFHSFSPNTTFISNARQVDPIHAVKVLAQRLTY